MTDIKSDEVKYLVCATPHFSADNAWLTIDEIMAGVVEGRIVYEALGCKKEAVKPYWDCGSESEMLGHIQLATCMEELKKKLGDTNGVMVADASGPKNGKWIVSFHCIGFGYTTNPALMLCWLALCLHARDSIKVSTRTKKRGNL